MTSKPRVTIAVLTQYERTGWVHPSILGTLEILRRLDSAGKLDFSYRFEPVHGSGSATYKRNLIAKHFKESSPASWGDWLTMIDNDMEIPPNFMEHLTKAPEDASVVCPRQYFWDATTGRETTTLCWGISSDPTPEMFARIYTNRKGYTRLIKCGSGVVSVHRRVFDKIELPYFKRLIDPVTDQEVSTEDVYFSMKVKDAGLRVYGCNFVEVGHYHNVNLSTVARALYDPVFAGGERVLTTGLGPEQQTLDNEVYNSSTVEEERPSDSAVATV